MLVLTRKNDESLRIGPNVRIRVITVSGRQVRLGIEAPPEVQVVREELYDRVAEANRAAASEETGDSRE